MIFGNAAQDILIEADIDRISRTQRTFHKRIRFKEKLILEEGLWLKAEFDSKKFGVKIDLANFPGKECDDNGKDKKCYYLEPGEKYSLKGNVVEIMTEEESIQGELLLVNCTGVEWGGGGLNMCKFLRHLVPSETKLPITYLDVGMTNGLHGVIEEVGNIEAIDNQQSLDGIHQKYA